MMKRDDFERWYATYEAERNSLLAVIEQKNASIQLAIDMFAANGLDLPKTIETLRDDLALTPENVRMVEVGWQFLEYGFWFMGSNHHNHRKNTEESGFETRPIFSIETTETSHSFIEAKGE
jgi:hypothetical protein